MFKNLVVASAMTVISLVGFSSQSMAISLDVNTIADANLGDGLVGNGIDYDALLGGSYGAFFENGVNDPAGNAVFNFKNNSATNFVLSILNMSVTQSFRAYFSGGVSVWFVGEEGNTQSVGQGVNGVINNLSTILGVGEVVTLVIAFGDPVKTTTSNTFPGFKAIIEGEVGDEVPGVPVPPALLLLGTALLGMGALGRRRKAAN